MTGYLIKSSLLYFTESQKVQFGRTVSVITKVQFSAKFTVVGGKVKR